MQNGNHLHRLTWNYSACVGEAENPGKHADTAEPGNLVDPGNRADPGNPGNHASRANNLYLYYKWDSYIILQGSPCLYK